MQTYKDKKVAILGLSVEGIDSARFFKQEQAVITCCDRRTKEQLGETFELLNNFTSDFRLGENYLSDLQSFDILVRTPGMNLRTQALQNIQDIQSRLTSQTKLFFANCEAPIIGVTGTKGKGTTATLIYEMIKQSGQNAWLGGNVGTPLLSKVREVRPSDIVVLELSSFQLEDLTQSPHIAVVHRITQEHLANFDPLANNYHQSRDAYVEAKRSIVRFQTRGDVAVINADDPTCLSFQKDTPADIYLFSRTDDKKDAFIKDKTVYLRSENTVDAICHESEIQLIGMHNLEDIAAAAIAVLRCGVPIPVIQKVAKSFKGLEHRLEFVKSVRGVTFYNDSFSTVPETTVAAIQSFSSPVILIVGGSEKGSDYSELGKEIASSTVKKLIVIGAMTDKILNAVNDAKFRGSIVRGLATMGEIVTEAYRDAEKGDVVLLSPACASFDMFKNYKERGKQFKHEVANL